MVESPGQDLPVAEPDRPIRSHIIKVLCHRRRVLVDRPVHAIPVIVDQEMVLVQDDGIASGQVVVKLCGPADLAALFVKRSDRVVSIEQKSRIRMPREHIAEVAVFPAVDQGLPIRVRHELDKIEPPRRTLRDRVDGTALGYGGIAGGAGF